MYHANQIFIHRSIFNVEPVKKIRLRLNQDIKFSLTQSQLANPHNLNSVQIGLKAITLAVLFLFSVVVVSGLGIFYSVNPTTEGVRILWVGFWIPPPLRNQWWSRLRPHVAIDKFLRYKFRDHMQKFGLQSRKLAEISRFKNLVKLIFHVTLVYKNCHNSLNFEATGLIFCMQAWFW